MKQLRFPFPAGINLYPASALLLFIFMCSGCKWNTDVQAALVAEPKLKISSGIGGSEPAPEVRSVAEIADATTILNRKQVPILCYHHVKDWKPTTSQRAKDYIVPVEVFKQQMKMLADSGYQTILPDQLYNYLATGAPLPAKPVILSFDDTDLEQYTVAAPEMKKYGFKGVFFIMTVSLGRPNYMTREQVKELSESGNEIGSHTWDHRNVKLYEESDWATQIEKPTRQLEAITGKPIKYFAYPFGLWKPEAIPQLKKRGFVAAFQLATQRDENDPLFTIRRIIVPGSWSNSTLYRSMQNSFK